MPPMMAESGVIRNYVETLLALPWGIYGKDNFDLKHAEKVLNKDHYGLEKVKERILELCSERDISINKLSSMSGVTQSTVNNIVSGRNRSATISTIKSSAMVWESQLRTSSTLSCSEIWNRKSNKKQPAYTCIGVIRM